MLKSFKIFENKQVGELYHWTTFASIWEILKQNYLKGSQRGTRDDAVTISPTYGVCFTRDKHFHGWKNRHYPQEVCIVIDGDKLSNNYKLFPYNDFFEGKDKPTKKIADEMETRTDRSIENIIKYIKRIELYWNDGGASEKEQLDFAKYLKNFRNFYTNFDVENYKTVEDLRKDIYDYVKTKNIECIMKYLKTYEKVSLKDKENEILSELELWDMKYLWDSSKGTLHITFNYPDRVDKHEITTINKVVSKLKNNDKIKLYFNNLPHSSSVLKLLKYGYTDYEGRYLTLQIFHNYLRIELTSEGKEEIHSTDEYSFSELFDDIRANSEYYYLENIGEYGLGLSSAPGITDGYYYDDDGEFTDNGHLDSKIWIYNNYMIRSFIDDLKEKGYTVFYSVD